MSSMARPLWEPLHRSLARQISAVGAATIAPDGELPADGYQEPEARGDDGYYRTAAGGYYQAPEA